MASRTSTLTGVETALKTLLGVVTLPLAPLVSVFSVRQNWRRVIRRFGKVDRVCEPGLRYAPYFTDVCDVFMGVQTHKFTNLHVVECNGTPIVVSVIMNFRVGDPETYVVRVSHLADGHDVLFNAAEVVVRNTCRQYPLVSEQGTDIRHGAEHIATVMKSALQAKIDCFGVVVDSLDVVKADYAPEVAKEMLMKQQAQAITAARTELVEGAVGIVDGVLARVPFPNDDARSRFAGNLLIALVASGGSGHVQVVQPLEE